MDMNECQMLPKEINIICVGDLRYRFTQEIIKSWDFDYSDDVLRIDFTDGSFVEFYKNNIVCVEFNKEICKKEDSAKGGKESMTNQEQYDLTWEKAKKYDKIVEEIDKIKLVINSEAARSFCHPIWVNPERARALEWALDVIDRHLEKVR